jgi:hypothetical protein
LLHFSNHPVTIPKTDWRMGMKLEDVGRSLDNEIDKLRKYIDEEVRPETRKELADFLRRTSEKLTKLAEKVDEPKH